MTPRLRAGAFIPPLHAPWRNPTMALRRDLSFATYLDEIGCDELWFGEHHGLGWEISGSPELMIAAAAERTSRVKLGTGAITLPFHHPLVVADRLVQLDHMTQGRLIFGAGPGAFPSDAYIMGLDYAKSRDRMVESLEAIIALLVSDEPVFRETDWFSLCDARLNLRPYSDPCFEICVTAVTSPSGPRLAGQLGLGVLSNTPNALFASGGSAPEDNFLRTTWALVEEHAEQFGRVVDRSRWRCTVLFHIAETEEQARRDVRYGIREFLDYRHKIQPKVRLCPDELTDIDDIIDHLNENGLACIGSPDRLVEAIDNLEKMTGGFGAVVSFVHEMADYEATCRSHALFMSDVMTTFQGSNERPMAAFDWVAQPQPEGQSWDDIRDAAIALATRQHEAEAARSRQVRT